MTQLTLEGPAIVERTRAQSRPAGGVARAVEAAYLAHYRSVYRYVLAQTRSADDAEEVAAETFARAVRAWPDRPPAAGRELVWLLVTARRVATDRWRRARRVVVGVVRRVSTAHDPHRETEFWLWFDALARVLTPRQREVLVLRYQRDLTDDDIANVMGLSPSGVRSLVARALEALRAHPELQ